MNKLILLFLGLAVSRLLAEVQPAAIFTDGTVLQQKEPVRIWGIAAPGETVTVKFSGQSVRGVADETGKWLVTLNSMKANATGQTLSFDGSATAKPIAYKDVLVGEVWLAGGQSNMARTMGQFSKTTQRDIDQANDPLLRMMTTPRIEYAGQTPRGQAQWKESVPANVTDFSATAYYFAKNLREALKVPVGIISCSVGATPAEAWMSRTTLSSQPDLKRVLDAYDHHVATAFKDEADYMHENFTAANELVQWLLNKAKKK